MVGSKGEREGVEGGVSSSLVRGEERVGAELNNSKGGQRQTYLIQDEERAVMMSRERKRWGGEERGSSRN